MSLLDWDICFYNWIPPCRVTNVSKQVGSCRSQMGPMLAPWTLLSRTSHYPGLRCEFNINIRYAIGTSGEMISNSFICYCYYLSCKLWRTGNFLFKVSIHKNAICLQIKRFWRNISNIKLKPSFVYEIFWYQEHYMAYFHIWFFFCYDNASKYAFNLWRHCLDFWIRWRGGGGGGVQDSFIEFAARSKDMVFDAYCIV